MNRIQRFLDEEGRVKTWASKSTTKLEILQYVAEKFEKDRIYTEKEVNAIIDRWHTFGDYFLIRRELVDHSLLARTTNGAQYWVAKQA